MAQNKPLGPFRLVTVNTAPERAKKIVGRVVEDVRETYTIVHAGNAESEQTVRAVQRNQAYKGFYRCSNRYRGACRGGSTTGCSGETLSYTKNEAHTHRDVLASNDVQCADACFISC